MIEVTTRRPPVFLLRELFAFFGSWKLSGIKGVRVRRGWKIQMRWEKTNPYIVIEGKRFRCYHRISLAAALKIAWLFVGSVLQRAGI